MIYGNKKVKVNILCRYALNVGRKTIKINLACHRYAIAIVLLRTYDTPINIMNLMSTNILYLKAHFNFDFSQEKKRNYTYCKSLTKGLFLLWSKVK